MIVNILLIIISITISVLGIGYVIIHRENYGTQVNFLLIILIYLFDQIIYFAVFNLSTEIYISKDIALIFWKVSIIIRILSLGLLSSIYSFMIEYKMKFIPAFIYSFLGGIILSLLLFPNSIEVIQTGNNYYFNFQNVYLLICLVLYQILIITLSWYIQISSYSNIRDKKLARMMNIIIFYFFLIISSYIIYILTQNILFKNLHTIFYLINAAFLLYVIIKKPDIFIVLTNKIYDFIIFHKSGILLYSYNFETGKETDDSILKGMILIGINHILSNFINRKDQLNLIKMKNRDIILEYDINYGYALLLITNQKNSIIERAAQLFMQKFSELNKEKLSNLNGLVDVSKFNNAKEIINEYFSPFIIKN